MLPEKDGFYGRENEGIRMIARQRTSKRARTVQ